MRGLFALFAMLAFHHAFGEAPAASRVALVIGNATYRDSPLINPVNDARALGSALRSAGFEVIEVHNQGAVAMRRAIREFGEKLRGRDAGLFYFAGHGVQVRGRNFLVPVDADIRYEDEIEDQSVEIGLVLSKMESAKARVNLVILDACRNNPFARSSRSGQNGLAPMEAPIGTLIAFATSPGQVASDGTGSNGLYTDYLVREMRHPGLKVEDVFKRVRASVRQASAGRQIPWENTSLEGDFYFRNAPAVDTAALEQERRREQEEAIQRAVASALNRSREDAEREKRRLEAFYTEKLEAERAAFRKEAAERIAVLEKAALATSQHLPAASQPLAAAVPPSPSVASAMPGTPIAPVQAPAALAAPAPAADGPAADARPEVVADSDETARTNDELPASFLLALGVDSTLRNKLKPVPEDVARGLRRSLPELGDTWTYYRTIRDGEGVERRNYLTRTVTFVNAEGYTMEQSDSQHPARFDADGNMFSGALRDGVPVVFDPVDQVYRFPLETGARWQTRAREMRPSHAVDVDATVTVGGWEEVTLPAGKFRALRISKVANRRAEPFPGQVQLSKRVSSYWFVPELRAPARFEGLEVTDRGAVLFDQRWELDSFELK